MSVSLWKWIELGVHLVTDYCISFGFSAINVSLSEVCTVHRWDLFILIQSSFHHSPFPPSLQCLTYFPHRVQLLCDGVTSVYAQMTFAQRLFNTSTCSFFLCLNSLYQQKLSELKNLTPTHYLFKAKLNILSSSHNVTHRYFTLFPEIANSICIFLALKIVFPPCMCTMHFLIIVQSITQIWVMIYIAILLMSIIIIKIM